MFANFKQRFVTDLCPERYQAMLAKMQDFDVVALYLTRLTTSYNPRVRGLPPHRHWSEFIKPLMNKLLRIDPVANKDIGKRQTSCLHRMNERIHGVRHHHTLRRDYTRGNLQGAMEK